MNRQLHHITFFGAFAILLSLFGCTEEDPTEPQSKFGKPSNVVLQKLSANSFSVSWTRAQNDVGTNTIDIKRTAPTTAQWQISVAPPTSILTIQDSSITLTGGSFIVTVASKDSISDPVTITIVNNNSPIPTGVQVTSLANNAFGVKWTRASGDVGVNKIVATPVGGGTEVITTVSSIAESGTINVPAPGKYTLQVESSAGQRSVAIEWATAVRSGVLTIYETYADANAGLHAGLILGPIARTASVSGSEKNQVDLVLATDNVMPLPYLAFQGADVAGSGLPSSTRKTRFGDEYYIVAGGLDADLYTQSFASLIRPITDPSAINYYPIDSSIHNPVILLARTADNHFARIEIVRQSDGYLWKDVIVGGNSYRAIDVIVSYQTLANVGYASRPTEIRRGTNTPRVGGARRMVK